MEFCHKKELVSFERNVVAKIEARVLYQKNLYFILYVLRLME